MSRNSQKLRNHSIWVSKGHVNSWHNNRVNSNCPSPYTSLSLDVTPTFTISKRCKRKPTKSPKSKLVKFLKFCRQANWDFQACNEAVTQLSELQHVSIWTLYWFCIMKIVLIFKFVIFSYKSTFTNLLYSVVTLARNLINGIFWIFAIVLKGPFLCLRMIHRRILKFLIDIQSKVDKKRYFMNC